METIPSWVEYWAMRQPKAVAILSPDGRSLTYAQLCEQILHIVLQLKSAHLKRNDRVALVLPNDLDLAVAILSTAAYATAVPVNPSLKSTELRSYFEVTKTKSVLLADQGMEEARKVAAEAGLPVITVKMNHDPEVSLDKIIEPLKLSNLVKLVRPDDTAFILPTSGTTSTPKAVSISQSSACADAFAIHRWLKLNKKDRCLGVMPLFHVHALFAGLLASLISGGSFISTPGYLSDKFFYWLKELKPTWYSAAPTIHQAIADDASLDLNQNILDDSRLRFIRSAAAPLSPELFKKIEDIFQAPLIETYGMTELRTFIAANPLPPLQRKPGSVGLEVGLPVAIIDSSGELLPAGESGEIVVSKNHAVREYIQDEEHGGTEIEDSWFRTGDIGKFDEEGYLFISGRSKEIIIRGGLNLSPVEIEHVLIRHNEIGEVVVFPTSHQTLGQDIAAAVVPTKGSQITEAKIRSFAFDNLAEFKVPSQVVIVDHIPRSAVGKVKRLKMEELLRDNMTPSRIAASSDTELSLIEIFCQVLDIENVGVMENFFALGGDSLRGEQVVNRINHRFNLKFNVDILFRYPTIVELANNIEFFLSNKFTQE